MDKTYIEAAIKRVEAFSPSNERDNVLLNLKALLLHVRHAAGEKLSDKEAKEPRGPTYTRVVDIDTDLGDLLRRDTLSKASA